MKDLSENKHTLLKMESVHLGKAKATVYVEALIKSLNISLPQRKHYSKDIVIDFPEKPFRINLTDAIKETQENGIPKNLQYLCDSRDRYLAPVLDIAVPEGEWAELSVSIGEFKKKVSSPGMIESPERSLAEDILFFRKAACQTSRGDTIIECSRYYRCYLQACISLVDCFLFRYAVHVKDLIGNLNEYSNTKVLGSVTGIEKRIEAWIETFAYHDKDNYKNTAEWSQFQEIRKLRNLFVHPFEPATTYSIRNMAKHLNLCRKGIGSLLEYFRIKTECDPNIGFIQRIKTAPIVKYVGKKSHNKSLVGTGKPPAPQL